MIFQMNVMLVVVIVVGIFGSIFIIYLLTGIKTVTEYQRLIVFRFGKYQQLKKDEPFENLTIEIESPTISGTTSQNLESAIKGEDLEWQEIYPNFANIADEEGYPDIAKRLRDIALIKKNHSQRFQMLLKVVDDEILFKKGEINVWKCLECGFEVALDQLPNDWKCPTCGHLKSYFQRQVLKLGIDENTFKQKKRFGWVCMECGFEVASDELPDNYKCPSSGHPKSFFRRQALKLDKSDILLKSKEKVIWNCMECGDEVEIDELPEDWKCLSCGRSKAFFRRKALKHRDYDISFREREKVIWTCLECGNEEEIELPTDWKCSVCGYPKARNT